MLNRKRNKPIDHKTKVKTYKQIKNKTQRKQTNNNNRTKNIICKQIKHNIFLFC